MAFKWLTNLLSIRSGITVNGSSDPTVLSEIFRSMISESGAKVDPTRILANPAVWAGVDLISSHIGKVPFIPYEELGSSRARAKTHWSYFALTRRPAPNVSPIDFFQAMIHDALIYGNSYNYRIGEEFVWLSPDCTYPKKANGILRYHTVLDGVEFVIPASDVIHIRGLSNNGGLSGMCMYDVLRDALGLGLALQAYGGRFFRNNAKPSMIVELPPTITDDTKIADFRKRYMEAHKSIEYAHVPQFVLPGTKVTAVSVPNNEGQWTEAREHDLVMVSNILGCPPSKLGSRNQISYASTEADNKNFLSSTLDKWLVKIEQELNLKLLTESELRSGKYYFEAQRKALIQTDARTEIELLGYQLNNNMLAKQEVRTILNRSIDDDTLDFFRQGSTVPADQVATPAPQPEPPQENDAEEERSKLKKLTESTVRKLVTRVTKSLEAHAKKEDWHEYIDQGIIHDHRSVALAQLDAFGNAKGVIDDWLDELRDELAATSKHDLPMVIERQNDKIDELTRSLNGP